MGGISLLSLIKATSLNLQGNEATVKGKDLKGECLEGLVGVFWPLVDWAAEGLLQACLGRKKMLAFHLDRESRRYFTRIS